MSRLRAFYYTTSLRVLIIIFWISPPPEYYFFLSTFLIFNTITRILTKKKERKLVLYVLEYFIFWVLTLGSPFHTFSFLSKRWMKATSRHVELLLHEFVRKTCSRIKSDMLKMANQKSAIKNTEIWYKHCAIFVFMSE